MLLRQEEGQFYSYPEEAHGVKGVLRRLVWKLGFDPLTVYERLAQVDIERKYWANLASSVDIEMRMPGGEWYPIEKFVTSFHVPGNVEWRTVLRQSRKV